MNQACRLETDVLHAAENDRWTDELRAHVAACADCAAAAEAAPWMARFAELDDREHILPDPSIVLLKAKILQNRDVADRVSRKFSQMQLISYFAVASGWAALLTWKWPAIQQTIDGFNPAIVLVNQSNAASSVFSPFFFVLLLLGSATLWLALHTMLAEE